MSSEAAWRYWGDGLEILRAGGVPASTLQWGIHIPTTVSKVVLNSFEAGVVSVAPNGALLTMAAVVWLGGVGLFAALLALGRAVGLRVLAVGVPALVLAVPASAPINAEFTQDADVYRVETLGRMAAVCAVVIAIGVVRGRAGLREAAVAGVLLGAAAGTHLIPVAVFGIFLIWYIAASLAVNPARRHRLARIARAGGVTALLTVVIWLAVLAASGGDLGFQRARGSGGYPGFPVTLDPTKSFEVIKRTHPKGRRTGWAIPPARVGEVALASVFEDLQVTTPRRDYVGLVLLALASGVVIWRRRRSLGPVTFASWATALTLTAVGALLQPPLPNVRARDVRAPAALRVRHPLRRDRGRRRAQHGGARRRRMGGARSAPGPPPGGCRVRRRHRGGARPGDRPGGASRRTSERASR